MRRKENRRNLINFDEFSDRKEKYYCQNNTCDLIVIIKLINISEMKTTLLMIVLSLVVVNQCQVLGIDFGTQFWKAALISPGKNLVIVENARSERKTLNSIAFQDGLRYFEDDAKNKRLKKPHLSYFYLNKLIASLDNDSPLEGYKFQNGTYFIEEGEQLLSLEQIVAMILKNIKIHASHQAGTDIKDVVLSIPANWGFKAKMSLVNAAYLADLSVLGLINENSAAAINFAISRNDTDPINIVFFNLGSHNLQISVIKLFGHFDEEKNKTIQSLQALSHVVAHNVGGLKIDQQIAHHLANEFHKKQKIDPKENKKSFTKLLVKSSEVKETLSANKDTVVYIEGLIDGIDLNIPIKRSLIDETNTFQNFEKYLTQALEKAHLTKDDIHSVQLIGGSSRIPKVNSIVKNFFDPVDVGAHINGDEAMAFGCALRAANLSLTFRVKQLHFYDGIDLNTKVVFESQTNGKLLEQNLFTAADQHGTKKSIAIPENSEDLKVIVYNDDKKLKQYTTKGIPDWKTKYEGQNVTGEPNLMFEFAMSSISLVELKDAYVNVSINLTEIKEKVQYVEEEEEIEVEVEVKDENKQEEKKQENQQEQQAEQSQKVEQKPQDKQQQTTEQNSEVEENKENTQTQENKENSQTQQEKPKTQKRKEKVKKTKTIKKEVEESRIITKKHIFTYEQIFALYPRYSKQQIEEKKKTIQKYEEYEQQIKDKAKIRNDFESALYNLKDNFDDQGLKAFSKEEEMQNLKQIVTKELQWMDENAWTANKQQFQQHFKTLMDAYQPMYNRTMEYRNRQSTYNETFKYLGAVYQKTQQLLKTHPWIEEKVNAHLKKINQTAQSIHKKLKEQIDRPPNQNPVIYNHEMVSMAEQLRDAYYLLRLIPRPKIDPKDLEKIIDDLEKEKEKEKKAEEEMDLDNEQTDENEGDKEEVNEEAESTEGEEKSQDL